MRVKSGVSSRATTSPTKRPTARVYPPKPALPKAAKRKDWTWHPLPVGSISALRDAGFDVLDRDDGQTIRSSGKVKLAFIHVRRTAEGRLLAQAGGNSPFGRPSAFQVMVVQARVTVDSALTRLAKGGPTDAFVSTLRSVRGQLQKAAVTKPPMPRSARIPSGIMLNPEERSTSVRAASAGLPTLGKRR